MFSDDSMQPLYHKNSKILILGSFPSVKSREYNFYYAHPHNRFWPILEHLYHEPLSTQEQCLAFLKKHDIALWNVVQYCDIHGSSDSSIKNIVVQPIEELIAITNIQTIYTNGKKAHELYMKYCYKKTQIKDICLPSTSSANAAWSLEKLIDTWKVIQA